jgi:large subunit ribosomal protein L9
VKLILTHEVDNLGDPGDIVEVKDGYGRNYLVPQGLAILATKGAEKQVASIRRSREVREVRNLAEAKELAAQLATLEVKVASRSGSGGRLFGSITAADIAAAVLQAGGPKLDRRRIGLEHPIKSLGKYPLQVRLHPDVPATVNVEVVPT